MLNLFNILPDNFFQIFSGKNREIYAHSLLILFDLFENDESLISRGDFIKTLKDKNRRYFQLFLSLFSCKKFLIWGKWRLCDDKCFDFFRFAHYIYCKRLSTFDIFWGKKTKNCKRLSFFLIITVFLPLLAGSPFHL